jgi:hypothetical protein
MIDIKRTFYTWSDTQQVATGKTVSEEGQGLVAVMEGGVEKVMPSEAGVGEKFVGFAMFRQKTFATAAVVEDHIIPTAAPFVVELGKQHLIAGQVRVLNVVAGGDFTPAAAPPAVAAGEFLVDLVHGTITFNGPADAGKTIRVFYRYDLTVAESIQQFYEAPTNHPDPNFFSQVGVGKGKGRVYTMFYDQSIDWAAATVVPGLLGAALTKGMITDGSGGGVTLIPNARVVNVPSPTDPYLGIEFLV